MNPKGGADERAALGHPRGGNDVTEHILALARSGDGAAFGELTRPFWRELEVHCYRFLGSVADAQDMLQETMMAAGGGIDRFEGKQQAQASRKRKVRAPMVSAPAAYRS